MKDFSGEILEMIRMKTEECEHDWDVDWHDGMSFPGGGHMSCMKCGIGDGTLATWGKKDNNNHPTFEYMMWAIKKEHKGEVHRSISFTYPKEHQCECCECTEEVCIRLDKDDIERLQKVIE